MRGPEWGQDILWQLRIEEIQHTIIMKGKPYTAYNQVPETIPGNKRHCKSLEDKQSTRLGKSASVRIQGQKVTVGFHGYKKCIKRYHIPLSTYGDFHQFSNGFLFQATNL